MAPVAVSIAGAFRDKVRLGAVAAEPIAVAPATAALRAEIEAVAAEYAAAWAGRAPSEVPGLAAARELYRALGIDPTRHRPSSEALFRRAVRGQPMPCVSNAVDVGNLCSLRFLLSLGLYDADAIRGAVTLRPGAPRESFEGIRKGTVHLEGRPVLVDDDGPFGNPTSDSLRTSVRDGTTALWMVVFAPASLPETTLDAHLAFAREAIRRHLAPPGREVEAQ